MWLKDGCLVLLKLIDIGGALIRLPPIETFLETSIRVTKIYATSSLALFCVASLVIANQFENIGLQIEENVNMFSGTADILKKLQKQYSSGKEIF